MKITRQAFSNLHCFFILSPAVSPLLTKYKNNGHTALTWGRYLQVMSDNNLSGMAKGGDAGISARYFITKGDKAYTILTAFLTGG
jgi:hypothetical protein